MTPQQELEAFLAKYDPAVARLMRTALARLRKKYPGANVLVYDNYNALAIGFAAGERPSEAVFSIAAYPRWVTLFFLRGVDLPDPGHRMAGSGKQVRSVRLEGIETLEEPAVRALLDAAAEQGGIRATPRGKLVVRSVSKIQRPRRPTPQAKRARP